MGEGGGVGGWGVVGEGRGGVGGATNQCTCNCYKSMYAIAAIKCDHT